MGISYLLSFFGAVHRLEGARILVLRGVNYLSLSLDTRFCGIRNLRRHLLPDLLWKK